MLSCTLADPGGRGELTAEDLGAWSTHTKPSHTRVNSPHFWSTHPIYEIKKDYSEGGLWYLSPIV